MKNFYLEAFSTFFKIGLFTIGGGYAMIPLIEEEVVNKKKWIKPEDFMDLLAVTQSVPGLFAVNFSIFIGYKLKKFPGALAMASGVILPSFTIILCIALFFEQFKEYQAVENAFKGIRPAVVALIAAPAFTLAKSAKVNRYTLWIPALSALLIWWYGISPVVIIVLAGLGGYLYGQYQKKHTIPQSSDESHPLDKKNSIHSKQRKS